MQSEVTERILAGWRENLSPEQVVRLVHPRVMYEETGERWYATREGIHDDLELSGGCDDEQAMWHEARQHPSVKSALAEAAKEAIRRMGGNMMASDNVDVLNSYARLRDTTPTGTHLEGTVEHPVAAEDAGIAERRVRERYPDAASRLPVQAEESADAR